MGLVLDRTTNETRTSHRNFEKMDYRFVLVTITMGEFMTCASSLYPRPYHWRLTDGNNPPFDISIYQNGYLREITFFIADNKILTDVLHEYKLIKGHPIFQVENWANDNYYLDEIGSVKYTLNDNDLYCNFSGKSGNFALYFDDKLSFLFNTDNSIVGLIIKGLNKFELKVLINAGLM